MATRETTQGELLDWEQRLASGDLRGSRKEYDTRQWWICFHQATRAAD